MRTDARLGWSQRARAARVGVTAYASATLAGGLFLATLLETRSPLRVGASFAAAVVAIACAMTSRWAGQGGRPRLLSISLLGSLMSFEVVAALFAAECGALAGMGLGLLIASWSAAVWLAPRRPWLVAFGVIAQTSVFLLIVKAAVPDTALAVPELAFIVAGIVMLTFESSNLGRRDSEDRTIWQKLELAHAQLEARRAHLARTKDGLSRRAEQQLAELLEHAKTSEQLDRLLADRVAGRSRELVREVDRRAVLRSDALAEGVIVGPMRVRGRITPGPYQRCFLGEDIETPSHRFVINMVHSADAHARVSELNAAIAKLSCGHPSLARITRVIGWSDEDLAVVSELIPGRMLIHALARSDLSWRDALVLGHGMAEALALAHARGCFHLGLDPHRIMLGKRGSGLTIYGAGLVQSWHIAGGSPVEGEQLLASPAYRALDPSPSAASDVYSLGIILFELVTKLHPLVAQVADDGSNAGAVLRRLQPKLDAGVCDLVAAMLSSLPSARPAMATVLEALARSLSVRSGDDLRTLCVRLSGSELATRRQRSSAPQERT
jgi:hypothetical protein